VPAAADKPFSGFIRLMDVAAQANTVTAKETILP
jgi:hypothetical protein